MTQLLKFINDVGDAEQSSTERLKQLFHKKDEDGNGTLEFDEFASMLRQGNKAVTDSQIRTLFTLADSSGDGHIDFGEFEKLINTESSTAMPDNGKFTSAERDQIKKQFKALNKSGNGALDFDELAVLLRR